MLINLLNAGLRAMSLISRLLLTLFLARQGKLDVLGYFGIISAVVAMAPAFLSMGMHYSLNRDLVVFSGHKGFFLLRDRFIIYLVQFFLLYFLGFLFFCFFERYIVDYPILGNPGLVLKIIVLLIFEVLGNEFYLALMSRGRPSLASAIQFFRNSIWVLPLICFHYYINFADILDSILYFWCGSSCLAFVFLVFHYRRYFNADLISVPFGFRYFYRNFKTSFFIFFSDISSVLVQYGDRFFLSYFLGAKLTGVYIFFTSLSGGVQQLVTAGFMQPELPKLIASAKNIYSDSLNYFALIKIFLRNTFLSSVFFSSLTIFILLLTKSYLNRSEVDEFLSLGVFIIFSSVFKCLYDAFGYCMYAKSHDREYAFSNFAFAFVISFANYFLIDFWGLSGAVCALFITCALLSLVRCMIVFKK